jgi:hypothetical protein
VTDAATDATPSIDRFRRPHPAWFIVVHSGLTTMAVMSMSQGAYDAISKRVPVPSRKVVQAVWVATGVAHVGEAIAAYRLARARGMTTSAPRWARETLFLGFPVLLELNAVAEGR